MFQVGAACYGSELQAAQAQASSQIGTIVQNGQGAYVVDVAAVAGNAITYKLHPVEGATVLQVVAPFSPQPCGLLTGEDGMQMGWMVVGVWVAVYVVLFLARTVRGETGGDYGNA